jgi:histidine phosphotransferase ChpT
MTDAPDLPALIAARICHDLISPMGAIGNGVELLEMARAGQGTTTQELALIGASVEQANARIRLFRLAFGPVAPQQTIGADELRRLLDDYAVQARFDLNWTPDQSQPRHAVKLGLLALLCAEGALAHGGTLRCRADSHLVELHAQSDRLLVDQRVWDALVGARDWPADLRAAQVQFPVLQHAVSTLGAEMDVAVSDRAITLTVTLP